MYLRDKEGWERNGPEGSQMGQNRDKTKKTARNGLVECREMWNKLMQNNEAGISDKQENRDFLCT